MSRKLFARIKSGRLPINGQSIPHKHMSVLIALDERVPTVMLLHDQLHLLLTLFATLLYQLLQQNLLGTRDELLSSMKQCSSRSRAPRCSALYNSATGRLNSLSSAGRPLHPVDRIILAQHRKQREFILTLFKQPLEVWYLLLRVFGPGSKYSVEVTAMAFNSGESEKQNRHHRKWSTPGKCTFDTAARNAPDPPPAPVLHEDRDADSFQLKLTKPDSVTTLTRLELLLIQAQPRCQRRAR